MKNKGTKLLLFISFILFAATSISAADLSVAEKSITFKVTHPFKIVNGDCKKIQIQNFQPKIGPSGAIQASPFSIVCDLTSIETGDKNRDSHVLEALGYPVYKEIKFQSSSVSSQGDGKYSVKGKLTINGVTKEIEVTATSKDTGSGISVQGEFALLMTDYKVDPPSLLFVAAEDNVVLHFKFLLK